METFDLVNIVIIAAAGAGLVLGAVLHHRSLKKAVLAGGKHYVRGLRRYRQ